MIPEEKLGVVILTNKDGSVLPQALMYKIFDTYLGGAQRDWSAEILKSYKALEAQASAVEKKGDAERVKGTSPSLGLEKYAGAYASEMYGDARVSLEKGKLVAPRCPGAALDPDCGALQPPGRAQVLLTSTSRTARCGPACRVVWEGSDQR